MAIAWEADRVSGDFVDFYRRTYSDLASYAWTLTRDAHVGDELAQEALSRVYARWPFAKDARPYAYRIVTNLARDRWRAQQRERAVLRHVADQRAEAAAHDTTLDAVRRLTPHLRDVVLLHYYADLPLEEVARVLHRPTGTVKRRLYDARAALAVALEETR